MKIPAGDSNRKSIPARLKRPGPERVGAVAAIEATVAQDARHSIGVMVAS
jgi:hypothetical protein